MKLLARPAPHPLESWPGYLNRLASQNRLNGLQDIADHLGILPYRLVVSSPGDILKLLGIKLSSDEGIVLDAPLQPQGRVFLARAGRSYRTRACPECMRDSKDLVILAEWDAALSLVCYRHQATMLDVCPQCAAPLTYSRSDLSRCACGNSLKMARTEDVTPDIGRVLRGLDLTTNGKLRPTFSPSTSQEILAAWLLKRLAIIDSGQFHARKAARLKGDAFVTTSEASAVSSWFDDWPNGFIGRLADSTARHNLPPSLLLGDRLSSLARELPRVADAVLEFSQRKRRSRRPSSKTTPVPIDGPTMGLKHVMTQTGCCYDAVKAWIRFGWLGTVKTEKRSNGNTKYFIETSKALHAIRLAKRSATITRIAGEVGLDSAAVRCLIRGGVINGIPFGVASWNVRVVPSQVFELARSLLNAAVRGKASASEVITLSTALHRLRKRNPLMTSAFIVSVQTGKLHSRKFIKSPISLAEITIREDDFALWIRRWNHRP